MYDGWGDLRDGYSKSLWSATGSPLGAAAFVALMALAYVVPPVAALLGSRVGAVGYVGAVSRARPGGAPRRWTCVAGLVAAPGVGDRVRLPDGPFLGRTTTRHAHLEVPPPHLATTWKVASVGSAA